MKLLAFFAAASLFAFAACSKENSDELILPTTEPQLKDGIVTTMAPVWQEEGCTVVVNNTVVFGKKCVAGFVSHCSKAKECTPNK